MVHSLLGPVTVGGAAAEWGELTYAEPGDIKEELEGEVAVHWED